PAHRHAGLCRRGVERGASLELAQAGQVPNLPHGGPAARGAIQAGAVMDRDEVLLDAENRMEKAVGVFRDELRGLRTGRATPALVDSLRVEYYGSPTPLKQMAQISTPDPQQILIRPYDAGVLKEIEKAIRSSDLGMSPNSDGKMIRLQVPPMSG